MTPDQFTCFRKALDAPPAKNLKAMRRLLNEPSEEHGNLSSLDAASELADRNTQSLLG
jgi:hypothetical protein